MKSIAVISAGSRGDVYPYAALGRALQERGWAVRLITFAPFRELVNGHGLEFFSLCDPTAALKSSSAWRCWQSSQVSLPRKLWALRHVMEQCRQPFVRMLDECLEACSGCHAIVSSSSGFAGPHIAEKLGLPFFWALLQPETPTQWFPYYLSPWSRSLGKLVNRSTYFAARRSFQFLFGDIFAQWRRSLQLAPRSVNTISSRTTTPVLYGFSRHVISKPADWNEHTHVTGYWFLDSAADWTPPEKLSQFLEDGPAPLAVCLSSINGKPDLLHTVQHAVHQTGQRAVVITSGSIARYLESSGVLTIDFAPYGWLFPKVTAIVHHGGAGTSAAALRAERPSILVPGFFDQSFWANTLYRLGVAPVPLSPHNITVHNLANAIHMVMTQSKFRQQAQRLGQGICAEDGSFSAAEILLQYLS